MAKIKKQLKDQGLTELANPRFWFGMAYAMLILVGIMSLVPAPEIDIKESDKLMHFFTYFILSAFFTALTRFNRNLIFVAVGLIGYGILLEFFQGMTTYRFMEIYDMLANSAGVICGISIRLTLIPEWLRKI